MMTLATGWYITLVTGLKVYTDRTASPKIKIQKIDKKLTFISYIMYYFTKYLLLHYVNLFLSQRLLNYSNIFQ
jgi:hypothetical protein